MKYDLIYEIRTFPEQIAIQAGHIPGLGCVYVYVHMISGSFMKLSFLKINLLCNKGNSSCFHNVKRIVTKDILNE